MSFAKYRWLPHLEGVFQTKGNSNQISANSIALEGWRRGLHLKFYTSEKNCELSTKYSLSNSRNEHHFSISIGDETNEKALNICENKEKVRQHLISNYIPVPLGEKFSGAQENDEILSYASKIGYPVILKPIDNTNKHMFMKINDDEELYNLLNHDKFDYQDFILEEYVCGENYRIFVIENQVVGALNRIDTSIVGDGVHTIKELVSQKNKQKKLNPTLTNKLIKIDSKVDKNLANLGYTIHSIPKKDEIIEHFSKNKSPIDVTKQLSSQLKSSAINVGKSIPSLTMYSVDIVINSKKEKPTILNINAQPEIDEYLFPVAGQPRDLAKYIIDFYFPETINNNKSNLFFDFNKITNLLNSHSAKEIKVATCQNKKLITKKYIVSGCVQKVGYRKWIRNKAHELCLHGYTRNLQNGDVEVVVASNEEYIINDFKNICYQGPKKANVTNVKVLSWNKPIKIGFEIKKTKGVNNRLDKKEYEKRLGKLEVDKNNLLKKINILERNYNQITQSKTWKLTHPIRYIYAKLRRKKS